MVTPEQIDMLKDFFAPENAEELEVTEEYRALAADLIEAGLIWIEPGAYEVLYKLTPKGKAVLRQEG